MNYVFFVPILQCQIASPIMVQETTYYDGSLQKKGCYEVQCLLFATVRSLVLHTQSSYVLKQNYHIEFYQKFWKSRDWKTTKTTSHQSPIMSALLRHNTFTYYIYIIHICPNYAGIIHMSLLILIPEFCILLRV